MKIPAALFHRPAGLSEEELIPLAPEDQRRPGHSDGSVCAFCEGEDRKAVWRLQDSPAIHLLECNTCHAVSASRLPTDAALEAYYARYYEASGADISEGRVTFDKPARLARRIAGAARTQSLDKASVLDFGGGDGTIAYLAAQEILRRGVTRVDVDVIDHDEHTIRSASPHIRIGRPGGIEETAERSYQLVIASAVLEHSPRPRFLLRDLLRRLNADDGLFYARTPFVFPLMKQLARVGVRLDFTFPGHLHDLGQHFWEHYFNRLNPDYRLIASRPSLVETTFGKHFLRTLLAHAMKAPWYLLHRQYALVGGWEVFARCRSAGTPVSAEKEGVPGGCCPSPPAGI
jgi:SAM-dependent methyltransferase